MHFYLIVVLTSYNTTCRLSILFFFFFNDTATTEIYTLSLHDALPISKWSLACRCASKPLYTPPSMAWAAVCHWRCSISSAIRSEEHTSELQSLAYLVCRLLLEKKKKKILYV